MPVTKRNYPIWICLIFIIITWDYVSSTAQVYQFYCGNDIYNYFLTNCKEYYNRPYKRIGMYLIFFVNTYIFVIFSKYVIFLIKCWFGKKSSAEFNGSCHIVISANPCHTRFAKIKCVIGGSFLLNLLYKVSKKEK